MGDLEPESEEAYLVREAEPPGPTWLSPPRLLALFCTLNMLIYMDRGVIASNGVSGRPAVPGKPGTGIIAAFELSLFQVGLLPAAFMVGLLAASPIFSEASKRWNGLRLIGLGLGVWLLAAAASGAAWGFIPLLLARAVVGVGEASFVALASPFIDDYAPPEKKARWLASFYLCIPTGIALGYVFGGLVGGALGWRAPFLLEAAAALPVVGLLLSAPALHLRGTQDDDDDSRDGRGVLSSLGADAWTLARLPLYVAEVGGMAAYTALLGALSYYGPRMGRELFDMPAERADLAVGVTVVLTGGVGTLAGGVALDAIGDSVPHALYLCAASMVGGWAFFMLALGFGTTFAGFMVLLALGELCMFVSMAPSNAAILWSVPPGLRSLAMSLCVVCIHLLGDVPSPPLLGWLQGRLRNWRVSLGIACTLALISAATYVAGGAYAARREAAAKTAAAARNRGVSFSATTEDAESSFHGALGVERMRLRLLAGQSTPNLAMLRELEERSE